MKGSDAKKGMGKVPNTIQKVFESAIAIRLAAEYIYSQPQEQIVASLRGNKNKTTK